MSIPASCTPQSNGQMLCTFDGSDPGPLYDHGDAAWVLTSTCLVLMMTTPAIGFFYGGLASQKNIISTIFMSIVCAGIVTVQWNTVGYGFAFGLGNSVFGNFDWAMLRFGVDYQDPDKYYAPTFPLTIHSAFQGTFAVITCAIISGSIVGRIKFLPYCAFVFLWSIAVYDVLCAWTWNQNGWLKVKLHELDFAGGTVVHISSATAGVVACWILGKRHDFQRGVSHPAPNVPLVILGAAMLWVGWLGFNAGSALSAGASAGLAMINTNSSAATAMMTWIGLDAIKGRISVTGASCGIVAGLVVITPACGYVHPGWAVLIGFIGAVAVYYSMTAWRRWADVDDTLDVGACHGVGGIVGSLCTGLFASAEWGGTDGAFYGNGMQFLYQLTGVVVTIAWSGTCTAAILYFLKFVFGGLRPTLEEEEIGLDRVIHGESWDLAMAAAEMVTLLTQKDQDVNGLKRKMSGKLEMTYKPHDVTEQPVHVEMSVASPSSHQSMIQHHPSTESLV